MKKLLIICLLLATAFTAKAQEYFKMNTYEENGKIGLLDDKGGKITAAMYDKDVYAPDGTYIGRFIATFYQGLCSAYINQKVGFIDKKGKEVVPFEYSSVQEFTVEGLAAVEKDGKWGFVNKKGKNIVPLIYNKVFDFENGQALVILDKEINFIDVKGEQIGYGYKIYGDYNEDNLSVIQNGFNRYGFLNGNSILPNFYDEIYFSDKKYFMVKSGEKIGIIDNHAKEIIPPIYDEFGSSDDKYFYLWKNNKKGIINLEGKIISPFVYGSLQPFKEGLSKVKLDLVYSAKNKNEDERYGYIDENGKEVIPRIYDNAADFKNGTAKVKIGDEEFFINKKGERIR